MAVVVHPAICACTIAGFACQADYKAQFTHRTTHTHIVLPFAPIILAIENSASAYSTTRRNTSWSADDSIRSWIYLYAEEERFILIFKGCQQYLLAEP